MNRITEITKRDILDVFRDGIDNNNIFCPQRLKYPYYGRLEEIEFLKRLYNLEKMPSNDSRYNDALEDVGRHTVNNDDYEYCWVFEDERFQLKNGNDEIYLKFLCEIFHPTVRNERGYWKEFLDRVNILLNNDGYELYPESKISNRDVYGWRIYNPKSSNFFIPYSQRNVKDIQSNAIVFAIKRTARTQIYRVMDKYNFVYQETDETGWCYNTSILNTVFDELRRFYNPECYNEKNEWVDSTNLESFIMSGSPYKVMDVIEIFYKNISDDEYVKDINAILNLNKMPFRLINGKITNTYEHQISINELSKVQEGGLKELLQEAVKYYEESDIKNAVEKLWDAFERLKTYYSPQVDKKNSVKKIVTDMSNNNQDFMELFDDEFSKLTKYGNDFRIRHHETTKIDIEDNRHYEYFYKRCLSLISVAIKYLENRIS